MWEIGGSSHNNPDARFGQEINVLLVDQDKKWLANTAELLQVYFFKVTTVETAVGALSVLSEAAHEFDLVLLDSNLHDMDAFTLLKLISKMDLLSMMMSEIDDDAIVSKALKSGAFLLVRRPFTADLVKQMRQHVIRERMQKDNKYDEETNVLGDEEINEANENGVELKRKVGITINEGGQGDKKRKATVGPAKKGRRGRKSNKDQECNSAFENNKARNGKLKRKACTEWTEELHEKFMDAVNQLGEGRCYPKEILELMDVPGLTRMQVASHLQKCRNDNWRAPVVRKYRHPSSTGESNEGSQRIRDNHRRFGSMPRVDQVEPNVQETVYTPEMTSSLGSEFTENEGRQGQQNRRVRNRFGSYPFMREGRGPNRSGNFYGSAQTVDNTDSELETNYIANEAIYTPAAMEKTSENHSYAPIYPDVGDVIPGGEYHSVMVDQKQPNDDFFNFLQDMDDYTPNLTRVLPEPSIVNQGSASQPFLYDYSQLVPDQAAMTNRDIVGQWSASAPNFFRSG